MDLSFSEKNKKLLKVIKYFLIIFFVVLFSFLVISSSKEDNLIHISKNQNFTEIATELEQKGVIRSSKTLIFLAKISGLEVRTGDYLFKSGSSLLDVFFQFYFKEHNVSPVKVTIREGLTNKEVENVLSPRFVKFNKDLFLEKTKNSQGFLFPDTYFFFPLSDTEEIIEELENNFKIKIKKLENTITESNKDKNSIIIMASILEGEARGNVDNKEISGILWKRLSVGMPLQVDVDRTTYEKKGLPEKPLNNPGLSSINAALNPTETNYLYYLHDKEGKVHFAKDYKEHLKNINIYLK